VSPAGSEAEASYYYSYSTDSEEVEAVKMPAPKVRETNTWCQTVKDEWGKIVPANGEQLEYVAYRRTGARWGRVMVRVDKRYAEDPSGRFFDATFLCASDKTLRQWYNKQVKDKKKLVWHICCDGCDKGNTIDDAADEVIHVDIFRVVSERRLVEKKKHWKGAFSVAKDNKSVSTAKSEVVESEAEAEDDEEVSEQPRGRRKQRSPKERSRWPDSSRTRSRPSDASRSRPSDSRPTRDSKRTRAEAALDDELDTLDEDAAPADANPRSSGAKGETRVAKMLNNLDRLRAQVQGRGQAPGPVSWDDAKQRAKEDAKAELDAVVSKRGGGSSGKDEDRGIDKGAEILARRAAEKARSKGSTSDKDSNSAQKNFFAMFKKALGIAPFDSEKALVFEEATHDHDGEFQGATAMKGFR